ncbi:hypothetical protein FB451DRAFT_1177660 [Mycena latifolia]|nr:hypothetical protein FB451DRAFT_1177660 [Mycena latifolia]
MAAKRYTIKKWLPSEQATEVDVFLSEPPSLREAKVFTNLLVLGNQMSKIITATPVFEISPDLKVRFIYTHRKTSTTTLLSSKTSIYKGDGITNILLAIIKKHRFGIPANTENILADWAKVVAVVEDALTQKQSKIKNAIGRCEGCTRVACALAPLHPQDETNRPIWKYQESAYGNFPNRGSSAAASLTTTATTSTPGHHLTTTSPYAARLVCACAFIFGTHPHPRSRPYARHSRPSPSFLRDIATAWARIQGTTVNPPQNPGYVRYSPQNSTPRAVLTGIPPIFGPRIAYSSPLFNCRLELRLGTPSPHLGTHLQQSGHRLSRPKFGHTLHPTPISSVQLLRGTALDPIPTELGLCSQRQIAYVRKDVRHTYRRTPTPVDVEVLTEPRLRPSSDRRLRAYALRVGLHAGSTPTRNRPAYHTSLRSKSVLHLVTPPRGRTQLPLGRNFLHTVAPRSLSQRSLRINSKDKDFGPPPKRQNIFELAQAIIKGSQCSVNVILCARIALMCKVYIKHPSVNLRDKPDNRLVTIRKESGGDANKLIRYNTHNVKNYELDDKKDIDEFQQSVDDLIEAGNFDAATSAQGQASAEGEEEA